MDFQEQNRILEGILIIVSTIAYLYPLQKREPIEMRLGISATLGSLLILLAKVLLTGNVVMTGLRALVILCIVCIVVYECAAVRFPAAIYVAIWICTTPQAIINVWYAVVERLHWNTLEKEIVLIASSAVFYAIAFLIVSLTIARNMPEDKRYHVGPRKLAIAIIFYVAFENVDYLLQSLRLQEGMMTYYYIMLLAQIYCITIFYFSSELFKKSYLERELMTMNMLMKEKENQYALTKENIELINRKCHDLKHQIRALQSMGDEQSKDAYIQELEKSVEIYGAIVKTGNDVLDTILTEKSLACQAKGIKINCVADGAQLDFMNPVDLYAILGNAVDNAVEAVEEIDNPGLRLVDIAIFTKDQFLVINISNPIERELRFKNGLPVSTKTGDGYHGFGLRSIRHNLAKYDGFMHVNATDKSFTLKMILPLNKNKKEL